MPTPFDINSFLKGQPVVTTNGKPIGRLKELRYKESEVPYLTAIIDNVPAIWNISGTYVSGTNPGLNLLMADIIVYKWAVRETIVDEDPQDDKTYIKVIIPE